MKGSCSVHVVYAPHKNIMFAVMFTMLIHIMLVHGYTPDNMLAFVLVSIPKDHSASLINSTNCRAIVVYPSIGKIIDMQISDRYSNQFMTPNGQFAFNKGHSTSMLQLRRRK